MVIIRVAIFLQGVMQGILYILKVFLIVHNVSKSYMKSDLFNDNIE